MTNEEQALEVAVSIPTDEYYHKSPIECAKHAAEIMAERKDSEFAIERKALIEKIDSLKEQRAVLMASNEKFRKEFLDKACKWLAERECWDFYDDVPAKTFREEDIEEFRKYMEEE